MVRRLIAALLLAAPAGAALGQTGPSGNWDLAQMSNGCMVQAVSPKGTMLSIWGFAGEDKLGFLLQNRGWESLRDGASYNLSIDFDGAALPVKATARSEIDDDGPGLYFTLQPGATSGKGFLEGFSTAKGMRISQEGRSFDTLSLTGSSGAMSSLARCLADRWSDPNAVGGPDFEEDGQDRNTTI
jgi:hypothetical protein